MICTWAFPPKLRDDGRPELLASVERAVEQFREVTKPSAWREDAATRVGRLTPRQRQIMELVLTGHHNKNIAAELGISQRAVENHRASIMKKDRLEVASSASALRSCRDMERRGALPRRFPTSQTRKRR